MKINKVVVTGATGYIGKHLVASLVSKGFAVQAIVRNSSDTSYLKTLKIPFHQDTGSSELLVNYFKENQFDAVIHLASCYIKDHQLNDIENLIDSNVLFSTRVLQAACEAGIKYFINTGTVWQNFENKSYAPVNLYAATKQSFEDIAQYYCDQYGISFTTLKLTDTYGPRDTRAKIINRWFENPQKKLEMSAGQQQINLVHIDDVVSAYLQMLQLLVTAPQKNNSYVVQSKQVVTLKQLATLFEEVTGLKLNIVWGALPYRPKEIMRARFKGKAIPGWKEKISLPKGLKAIHQINIDSKRY